MLGLSAVPSLLLLPLLQLPAVHDFNAFSFSVHYHTLHLFALPLRQRKCTCACLLQSDEQSECINSVSGVFPIRPGIVSACVVCISRGRWDAVENKSLDYNRRHPRERKVKKEKPR